MFNFLTQFAAEAAAEKSGIAVLGINPVGLMLQLVTFLILFAIIKKFALSGIIAMLEKRRKTINDGIRLGRNMEAEHAKMEELVEKTLRDTRHEADKILAAANQQAGEILKSAEITAERKTTQMLSESRAQLELAVESAKKQLKYETANLVADATGLLINEKLDINRDSAIIAKALKEAAE